MAAGTRHRSPGCVWGIEGTLGTEGPGGTGGQGGGVAGVGAAGGGAGPDSAPKAAERKEEAAKISRWVDREEIIAKADNEWAGEGGKEPKCPQEIGTGPWEAEGGRGGQRHRAGIPREEGLGGTGGNWGSCAPGGACGRGKGRVLCLAAWETRAEVGSALAPSPRFRQGQSGRWVGASILGGRVGARG